ncbi:hypothetical protein LCGC14_1551800 [marine sediment metagenome]|uniref:Uncharacterized protein n=1 Tax=marine sediment metagenome TaxID=412755 RepID=A0A0F9L637_9ZZZZ
MKLSIHKYDTSGTTIFQSGNPTIRIAATNKYLLELWTKKGDIIVDTGDCWEEMEQSKKRWILKKIPGYCKTKFHVVKETTTRTFEC